MLMALQGELAGPGGVPHLKVSPEELPSLLKPLPERPLEYSVDGYPGYAYRPYWKIDEESFTCYPIIQA